MPAESFLSGRSKRCATGEKVKQGFMNEIIFRMGANIRIHIGSLCARAPNLERMCGESSHVCFTDARVSVLPFGDASSHFLIFELAQVSHRMRMYNLDQGRLIRKQWQGVLHRALARE